MDDPRVTEERRVRPEDEGGEPVCWLMRVCPECGCLNEVEDPVLCEYCGACFPT